MNALLATLSDGLHSLHRRISAPHPAAHALLLALALLSTPSLVAQPVANGQRLPPRLGFAYPAGAAQGSTITITLGGERLADTKLVHFNSPGLTAKITGYERPFTQRELTELRDESDRLRNKRHDAANTFTPADAKRLDDIRDLISRRSPNPRSTALAESVTIELTVATDAAAGPRELRVATPAGLSNPLIFQIGTLPEVTAPVVTSTSQPQRRALQQAATKRSAPLDVTLPVVVNGQILSGEVDTLRFSARRGQQLTCALQARALIPYLADAVPGWFQAVLHLRDGAGHEIAFNDDFQFRPDPVIGCELPADGIYTLEIHDSIYRGREDFVYRVALGELPFVRSVFPLGAPRTQDTTLHLTGWNLPNPTLPYTASGKPAGTMLLSVRRDGHASNQIRFALSDAIEVTETASPTPTALPLPGIANGRISHPDERDIFRFFGHAGQSIVAEVFARRIDSPLDSFLELHGPDGHLIASNDDTDDPSEGLLTHQADSRLALALPADGEYKLAVADTQHRGGEEFGYRLQLRAPSPDFALRLTPSAVNIPAGGSAQLTVFALRRDGFDGPIDLTLVSPARGLRLNGARIPAGADSVQLTITAQSNLPAATLMGLTLSGTGYLRDGSITRSAVACDDTMQAFLWRHLVPATECLAQILPRGPALIAATPDRIHLAPGQPTTIQFDVTSPQFRLETATAELVSPPPELKIIDSKLRHGRILEVTLLATNLPTVAQRSGNLIFSISGTRLTRTASENKNNAKPRLLGLAPALPYDYVVTESALR